MNIPDLDVSAAIVLCPDTEHILAASNADHSAAYFLTSFEKLISNESKQQILPIPVRNPLLEPHDPLATLLVLFVLPHRPNVLLEEVIIGHGR